MSLAGKLTETADLRRPTRKLTLIEALLRIVGIAAFAAYLGWNIRWLSQGLIPGSLFQAFTGLPCPTTGGTRAIACLLSGEWQRSLLFNPLAVPMLGLLLLSAGLLVRARVLHGRYFLPYSIFTAWVVVLLLAWIAKLALPREYW